MKIACFDPYSGASGNMVLGALIDCGLLIDALRQELAALPIQGYELRHERVVQHGVWGSYVSVPISEPQPERDWRTIRDLIESSALSVRAREAALEIFTLLAVAEAKVHGVELESVHFHEVGAVDSIVDICGVAIGFDLLGIEAFFTRPVRTGSGLVSTRHGLLPVPAPAAAEILARTGLTVALDHEPANTVNAELLTPTGAAIIGALASPGLPEFTARQTGYGYGSMQLPWPNALRLWIGELASPRETELLFETNIDDMNPQAYELLMERLFQAGALDVWMNPVLMKKNRPGTIVSAIAPRIRRTEIESVFLMNSTSLGVRATEITRAKADRRTESLTTRFGEVAVKLKIVNGRVVDAVPEYDDCVAAARSSGATFAEIWNEAHRIAERFVGRRDL